MKKFRSFKDIRQFKVNCNPNRSQLVQPSIMAELSKVKVTYYAGDDKYEAVANVDDIYLLFNQQRLLYMGADTLNAWLNSLQPRSDSLSELRKKCTDEQLMQICKSRYIQSPSELLAWSDYLNANYADIVAKVQAAQQQTEPQQQQQQAAQALSAQASASSE